MPITRYRRVSVTRYNPETWTYSAAIATAGGSISAASLGATDAFVSALKLSGTWSKVLDCWTCQGNSLAAGLVKLVGPALTNHNFLSGDYTETGSNGGLNANGSTKYLDTGVQLNSGTQAGLVFYNRTAPSGNGSYTMIGAAAGGGSPAALGSTYVSGSITAYNFAWGSGSAIVANQPAAETGLFMGVCNSTADSRLYYNGTQLNAGAGGTLPVDAEHLFAFANNNAGTANQFWTGRGSFYAITGPLNATDIAALSAAVLQLQTALNRI
jgi:hypothetical protein